MIGAHLASLNLFREKDGTVEITVANGDGAVARWQAMNPNNRPARPIDYVETLIVEAAQNMAKRILPAVPDVPPDVWKLVVAARRCLDDESHAKAVHELDQALEAFASRVPYEPS